MSVVDDARTALSARPLLQPRPTAWRAPLAAACLIAAVAHVPVTGEHLEEALYIGVLFIALEVAATLLAIRMLRTPTRAALLAISAVGALAVLAFVVSRTVGLPLIGDDIGEWTEPLAVVSVVAESVMAIGGLVAGVGTRLPTRRIALAGALTGLLLLGTGTLAVGAAANAETGHSTEDEGHGHMDGMDMHDMDHMDMGSSAG